MDAKCPLVFKEPQPEHVEIVQKIFYHRPIVEQPLLPQEEEEEEIDGQARGQGEGEREEERDGSVGAGVGGGEPAT
jgi:hypothetical protein